MQRITATVLVLFISLNCLGQISKPNVPKKPGDPGTTTKPGVPAKPGLPNNPGLPSNPGTTTFTEWKSFVGLEYGIKYPNDWDLDSSGESETQFVMYSPKTNSQSNYAATINLIIQDLAGYDIDLDDYASLSQEQIESMFGAGSMISSERLNDGPLTYHKMEFTGAQDGLDLKFFQHYYISKEKAFVLTFRAEQSVFNDYLETAEKIFDSFTIEN